MSKAKDRALRSEAYRQGGFDAVMVAVILAGENGGWLSMEYLQEWLMRLHEESNERPHKR